MYRCCKTGCLPGLVVLGHDIPLRQLVQQKNNMGEMIPIAISIPRMNTLAFSISPRMI